MGFLSRVTVAPITSTVRGSPSEVILGIEDGLKGTCAVNLDQTITVPKKHIGRWVASLRRERMREVCVALGFALGCEE
jgi:mRNA interferase MazF